MTPYQTPHTQQTPRYGHQTPGQNIPSAAPHMNGPFLHPGAVTPSHRTPSYRNLPSQSPIISNSPHPSPHSRGYGSSKNYPSDSPRDPFSSSGKNYSDSRSSRNNAPSFNSHGESMDWQKAAEAWARSKNRDSSATPRSERNTPRSMGQRTPRSVRSTPRTNTSPHSMSLGDATPLYDENI